MNVKAILISNSIAIVSPDEFLNAQNEMNKPIVIFMDENTSEVINHYEIVAEDVRELLLMFENKIFYTSSIQEGKVERHYGAIFYGVTEDFHIKEKSAQVQLNA